MNHAILGVWAVESRYADRPRTDRGTFLFHPGGTASIAYAGYTAHAVWQATSEHDATISGTRPVGPDEGFVGWFSLNVRAQVSGDGMSISMDAIETRPRPDGSRAEQRATITGTRVVVQP